MAANLELYATDGTLIFDSSRDRIMSHVATFTAKVVLPKPVAVNKPTQGWFSVSVSSPLIETNALVLHKVTSVTNWSSSWTPITESLTYCTVENGMLTVYVYCSGIYQSVGDVTVNLQLKVFRR